MFGDTGSPRPTILVVDDSEDIRTIARLSLEELGFSVLLAEEGRTALNLVTAARPDLVLLDVVLPGMDGFAVCSELRSMSGGSTIPILMITGLEDLESMKRAYEAGATDFVTKPFNWFVLAHRLMYMLRSSELFNTLCKSEAKNRALLDAMPDAMIQITRDGTLLDYKAPRDGVLFIPSNGHAAHRLEDLLPHRFLEDTFIAVEKAFANGASQMFEHNTLINGLDRFYEIRVVVCAENEALMILRDITERKLAEEHIRYMAYHDSLTRLPNTYLFREHIKESIETAHESGRLMALLFIDLDRFKLINDTLGHQIGDRLLQAIADRIKNGLRRSDKLTAMPTHQNRDIAARLGGDEFTLLLSNFKLVDDVTKVAQRTLEEIAKPFIIESHELFITASIGIALFPQDGDDVEQLLRNADAAMYHAKVSGRNNFQFYDLTMNSHVKDRLVIENRLRKAAASDEFTLHYQPIVSLSSGMITELESLIRWFPSDMETLAPAQIVSMCEEIGIIGTVGEWVLRTGCRQVAEWRRIGLPVTIAVNLSIHQFRQQELVSIIRDILSETGLDPSGLNLEITESIIMQDIDTTVEILKRLKDVGVTLSIDDFGTGYSSLSYLRRFPIDSLKIARSFLTDITTNPDDAAIVRAIIALAHTLKLKVVSEGVESQEQLDFLRAHGCDAYQGFHFSRPLAAGDITTLLRKDVSTGKRELP